MSDSQGQSKVFDAKGDRPSLQSGIGFESKCLGFNVEVLEQAKSKQNEVKFSIIITNKN